MNKKTNGHTLPELMIYMVLGVIVTGLALQAIGHIAKNYVHGREVTKMQQSGRDAINVMSRDLANTGFKHIINRTVSGGTATYTLNPRTTSTNNDFLYGTYTGQTFLGATPARDSLASFIHKNGSDNNNDTIEILRANLTDNATIGSISRVKYQIVNSILYRYSQSDANGNGTLAWGTVDAVAVLDSCEGLQFEFLPDGGNWSTGWIQDPTGTGDTDDASRVRHLMKYIRVTLLVKSDREGDAGGSGTIDVGEAQISRDGNHLYRTYQTIVPIPNNGRVIFQ